MFRKKIIITVVLISGILKVILIFKKKNLIRCSKFVNGKTCKFYPSYPEYGIVYSVE